MPGTELGDWTHPLPGPRATSSLKGVRPWSLGLHLDQEKEVPQQNSKYKSFLREANAKGVLRRELHSGLCWTPRGSSKT